MRFLYSRNLPQEAEKLPTERWLLIGVMALPIYIHQPATCSPLKAHCTAVVGLGHDFATKYFLRFPVVSPQKRTTNCSESFASGSPLPLPGTLFRWNGDFYRTRPTRNLASAPRGCGNKALKGKPIAGNRSTETKPWPGSPMNLA